MVLGVAGHAIAVGNEANLCIHESARLVDVLREHTTPRWVLRRGRVIAESTSSSEILRASRDQTS